MLLRIRLINTICSYINFLLFRHNENDYLSLFFSLDAANVKASF
jgi:hypothetical protein